jgi:hypothetical protein
MGQMITPADVHAPPDYERVRNEMRRRAVAQRKLRCVRVGTKVSVTFENRDTVLYQLQETIRDEGITGADALETECEVYAAMLPSEGALSATLSISVSSQSAAAELRELAGICGRTALIVGEEEILAYVDEGSSSRDMASMTCYVRFEFTAAQAALLRDPKTQVALRIAHPKYREETALTSECRCLLAEDLT